MIDEDQWSIVMAEDEDFDYSNLGVGRASSTPLPENEVQVYTSSAGSNAAEESDNDI